MDENARKRTSSRAEIIDAVRTPLGFFVLVVLVVEVALGGLAANADGENQLVALYSMVAVVLALIAVVAFLAFFRPEALRGQRPGADAPEAAEEHVRPTELSRVLCGITGPFSALGTEQDVAVLEECFPGRVRVVRDLDVDRLRAASTTEQFDIVHLLGYVDPRTGDFHFDGETLSGAGLLKLVELAGAKLVFLATCDSLALGAELARGVNVVAATDTVEVAAMIRWERMFYALLAQGRRLSDAYEVALATSDAPMRLIMHRDLAFILDGGTAVPASVDSAARTE